MLALESLGWSGPSIPSMSFRSQSREEVLTLTNDTVRVARAVTNRLESAVARLPDPVSLRAMTCLARFRKLDVGAFGYDPDQGLYYALRADGVRVYVAHRARLQLYRRGYRNRIGSLLEAYCIPPELVRQDDLVIDCGANHGEIGLWAEGVGAQYIGFEPDPIAYVALSANVSTGSADNRALSDFRGSAPIYLATASADSTLLRPLMGKDARPLETINCIPFSDYAESNKIKHVRLLKVEAEGSEPEVLRGAFDALGIVDFVALDAGPERRGTSPAPECLTLLSAQFELIDVNLSRGSFLFRNRHLHA